MPAPNVPIMVDAPPVSMDITGSAVVAILFSTGPCPSS